MATLYELGRDYQRLTELLCSSDGLTPDEQGELCAAFTELAGNEDKKAAGYVKVYKNMKATASAIDAEIENLIRKKQSINTGIRRLTDRIDFYFKSTGKSTLESPIGKFKLAKKPQSVVIDLECDIPAQYKEKVETFKIDKKAIKNAIKAGAIIKGATLSEPENYVRFYK